MDSDLKLLDHFLIPNEIGVESWRFNLKRCYNDLLMKDSPSLSTLHTDNGIDTEQIWQQLELMNETCIPYSSRVTEFEVSNLHSKISHLEIIGSDDPYLGLSKILDNADDSRDSGAESHGENEEDDADDDDEDISDDENLNLTDEDSGRDDDFDDAENEDVDDEEDVSDRPAIVDEMMKNIEDSDEDEEFGDLALEDTTDEETDSGDDNVQEPEQGMEANDGNTNYTMAEPSSYSKTSVDSKFLQIRQSEWIADNDVIGDNSKDNYDDINLMSDMEDSGEENFMYNDFFDGDSDKPPDNVKKVSSESTDESGDDDDENVDDLVPKTKELLSDDDDDDNEANSKQGKSLYERMMEKDKQNFEKLEANNVGDKQWVMKGEIHSVDRPENSLLQENLEITVSATERPTTNEQTTEQLEKLILSVIRSGAYDDVERKVRPVNDPNEYKKKLLLDQTKSKASLADIYEQEYLKQKEGGKNEDGEEPKEHKEIRTKMDSLFTMLDALANYHYTPRQKNAEVKIVSNLPALSMEESTPVSVNDATLLAPQEIVAPQKGDLQGKTEQTDTDRKRDRRKKKSFQKKKSSAEEVKLQKKLKAMSQNKGTLDSATSAKVVEKAIKRGQIKMMEKISSKPAKSFKDLGHPSKRKKDTTNNTKTKKLKTSLDSSTKLLI